MNTMKLPALPSPALECGDLSPLCAGDLSPSNPRMHISARSRALDAPSPGDESPDGKSGDKSLPLPTSQWWFFSGPGARHHTSLGQRPRPRWNQPSRAEGPSHPDRDLGRGFGPGFQPCPALRRWFLGRWPRLVWPAPLALRRRRMGLVGKAKDKSPHSKDAGALLTALCCLGLLLFLPAVLAQSSATSISFQGALTTGAGQPLPNGSYTLPSSSTTRRRVAWRWPPAACPTCP
jgi:hypothetical protein